MFTRRSRKEWPNGPPPFMDSRNHYEKSFRRSGTDDANDPGYGEPLSNERMVSRDYLYRDRYNDGPDDYRDNYPRDYRNGKQKQNHIEKQLNNALQRPVDMGPGHSMMQRMGWTGGGLGRSGEGIVEPIAPNASYVSGQTRNYGTGNLSGSAKRRFRRLVNANVPPEKAIHLCRKPLKELLEDIRNADNTDGNAPSEDETSNKDEPTQSYGLSEQSHSQNYGSRNCGPDEDRNYRPSRNFDPLEERPSRGYGLSQNGPYNQSRAENYGADERPGRSQNYGRSEYFGPSEGGIPRNYGLSQNGSYDQVYSENYGRERGFSPKRGPLDDYKNSPNRNIPESSENYPSSTHRKDSKERPMRVGIYNVESMNEDQMNMLHRALNQAILKIGAKGIGPRFIGLDHKLGWVQITCEDELSKDWLVDEVPKLKPWPEARLYVKTENDFHQKVIVTVYIPQYEAQSIDEALNLLGVQNEGLNTEAWRVFNGKKVGNGLVVAFSIDHVSLETLKANNLQAMLGFRTIQFKIKGNVNPFAISLKSWFDYDDQEVRTSDSIHESKDSRNFSGPTRSWDRRREMYRDAPYGDRRGPFQPPLRDRPGLSSRGPFGGRMY